MRYLTAERIFPVASPPIENGIIMLDDDGTILKVGDKSSFDSSVQAEVYDGWLIPGMINAHCHLELSYMKSKVTPGQGMAAFIRELLKQRFLLSEKEMQQSYEDAENEMLRNGIVAVGDISNFHHTLYIKQKGHLYYHTFVELLGMNPFDAGLLIDQAKILSHQFAAVPQGNSSVVPHAPYTVSPRLFQLLKEECYADDLPVTIHMQESPAEMEFAMSRTGDFTTLFSDLKFDFSQMPVYHARPVKAILPQMSSCNRLLLVHNTLTTPDDIIWAGQIHKNIYWTLCPKANLYIENRLPDIPAFINSHATLTLGTDSLTSNDTLSIYEEMKTIHQHFPQISIEDMIPWATINGAKALNIENRFGTLEAGKKPGIVQMHKGQVKRII
jgi:aminodeoxyfutalosine deaminase